MATPMSYVSPTEFMCCLCFGGFPLEEATFDLWDDGPPYWVLSDVCKQCRINETHQLILRKASYEES